MIGTHALIQEGVTFGRLGLAVADEQHRFGVLQREDLRKKGYDADVLVMTATPIPRTLALTAYGDLDVSIVDEKPPGRTPIRTELRPASERREVLDAREARGRARAGRPTSSTRSSRSRRSSRTSRRRRRPRREWAAALPGVRVGLLHGRMKSAEKEETMGAFSRGEIQVLVSTTVIEVGVDVPNATVMVIEHAERFGLAQLHQLRGRVGPRRGVVYLRAPRLRAAVRRWRARGSTSWSRPRTASRSRRRTSRSAARATSSAPGSGGCRPSAWPTSSATAICSSAPGPRPSGWLGTAISCRRRSLHFLENGGWERRFGLARVG